MRINIARLLVSSRHWLEQTMIAQGNLHLWWRRWRCIQLFILRIHTCPTESSQSVFEIIFMRIQDIPGWLPSWWIIPRCNILFFFLLILAFIFNEDFIYFHNFNLFTVKGSQIENILYKYHIPFIPKVLHPSWIEVRGVSGPKWHDKERIPVVVWCEENQFFSINMANWNLMIYLSCIQACDTHFIFTSADGAYIIITTCNR